MFENFLNLHTKILKIEMNDNLHSNQLTNFNVYFPHVCGREQNIEVSLKLHILQKYLVVVHRLVGFPGHFNELISCLFNRR